MAVNFELSAEGIEGIRQNEENNCGSCSSHHEESCTNDNGDNTQTENENDDGGENTNPSDDSSKRVLELTFKSVKEAEEFYIAYGRENGFDVRRSTLKKHKDSGVVKNREWLCSREGFRAENVKEYDRKREAKRETRCGCQASFRVALDRLTGQYNVTRFNPIHNHQLETLDTSHRLRCNRYLTPSTKAMLTMMTKLGFKPCQVLDFIEELGTGPHKVVFNRKDGYNYLNKERLKLIEGGDVNTMLGLLEGMKLKDESFNFKYTVDGNGALTRLFWCDGQSIAEYKMFGDVILFYSTYKTNAYRFPLVLFSGVNNHLITCIFGVAFLYNETIESYRWLLRTFRESMGGKAPSAVLTDQDAAMRTAVEQEYPEALHRLCCWHITRNVEVNVHIPKFSTSFSDLMKIPCSIEEFEEGWSRLVEEYNVADHPWVKEIYQKRRYWAEAFFRGHFFAMMRSTQRAESMNSLVKDKVRPGFSLTQFLGVFNDGFMKKKRKAFSLIQQESEKPPKEVLKGGLRSLENHVARICSRKICNHIRDEIKLEPDVVVESLSRPRDRRYEFKFGDFCQEKPRSYSATIDLDEDKYECECLMLQSDGIPCRHIICGFKNIRVATFPNKSIHERCLIDTGKKIRLAFPIPFPVEDVGRIRFAQMNNECANLAFICSREKSVFDKTINRIIQMSDEAEEELGTQADDEQPDEPANHSHNVTDPNKIVSKGGTKAKKQHCSICRKAGHKATTCELNEDRAAKKSKLSANPSKYTETNDECVGENRDTQHTVHQPSPSTSSFVPFSFPTPGIAQQAPIFMPQQVGTSNPYLYSNFFQGVLPQNWPFFGQPPQPSSKSVFPDRR